MPLYKAIVRPHLEYGSIIWGPFFTGDIKSLETIQRRATKLVTSVKDMSYSDRLRTLKLPSLRYRRRRADMLQIYKMFNGLVRIPMECHFKLATCSSTRGHQKKLFKSHAKKFARANFFSQRTINDWNNLPADTVNATSIDIFKRKLDDTWRDSWYAID